jgi:8-oxo-dGTP pyrophosphatase MutT (NUDIX family)
MEPKQMDAPRPSAIDDSGQTNGQVSDAGNEAQPPRPVRHASVALILYERDGSPWTIFTRRTELVGDHKGQISLPGGSKDAEDASLLATAIRETREELGIDPDVLQAVAAIQTVYTVATRYYIHPFVFYTQSRPEIRPCADEVAEVIDVPIGALLKDNVRRVERWDTHGVSRDVYFYDYGRYTIWGATGRVLKHFLDGYSEEWWESVRRGDLTLTYDVDGPTSEDIPV